MPDNNLSDSDFQLKYAQAHAEVARGQNMDASAGLGSHAGYGVTTGSAPALPTFQTVMRDIARLTYADHVRLAEALNHSPQVLNDLVGRWVNNAAGNPASMRELAETLRLARPVGVNPLLGAPYDPASTMDVATAMLKTPAYRGGYFKESADG